MSAVAEEVRSEPIKITQRITGWKVKENKGEDAQGTEYIVQIPETLERPRVVEGRTYKISPAVTDSAMYITINDIILEDGTRRPLELFINTKHVAHQQWITALTRMVSAIFRKPGPYLFVVEELKQIFDPQGGYFSDQKLMPSVVAHVAEVLQEHFEWIGALEKKTLSDVQLQVIAEKKEQAEASGVEMQLCTKCNEKAMLFMDGCWTCTACGDSKCG